MAGQPDAMLEIQEKIKEMTVLFDRVQKIDKKLEFQLVTKEEADRKTHELAEKLKQLEAEAQKNDIDINEVYSREIGEEENFDISKDPNIYDKKQAVIEQAMQVNQSMYSKKLEELNEKLKGLLQERNSCIEKIRLRHDQTIEKRQEVNDLMLKSKLISEDELEQQKELQNDKLEDLPTALEVDDDEVVIKIQGALKRKNKARAKLNKTSNPSLNHKRNLETFEKNKKPTNVPTTKNAFSIKQKATLPTSDNEDDPKPVSVIKKFAMKAGMDESDAEDMENSIENSSIKKPILGISNKPFGNKATKPLLMSKK